MTLLQLFMLYHLSISNSHAIHPGMKRSVLWRLLLRVKNALAHLFSNARHGCPKSFVPPNYIKSSVFACSKSPTAQVQAVYNTSNSAQLRAVVNTLGLQAQESFLLHGESSAGNSTSPRAGLSLGLTPQELRKSYLIIHKIIHKIHLPQKT